VLTTLIAATRAGELDAFLDAATGLGTGKRKKAA